jgi:hypothetical protein
LTLFIAAVTAAQFASAGLMLEDTFHNNYTLAIGETNYLKMYESDGEASHFHGCITDAR